jgi:hypothetical protein
LRVVMHFKNAGINLLQESRLPQERHLKCD